MRITQLMLAKGFGGAERYFVDLSLALAELGHEVQAICHRRFRALNRLQHVPGLRLCTFSPYGWWDALARRKIQAAIDGFRPEVVHAHLARGAYVAGRICASLRAPLVVKLHNYADLKYYRHVDLFITTTQDQRCYLLERGIDASRIRIIPNFSSLAPVDAPPVPEGNALVMAAYGRLVHKKGFHVLLRAFRTLADAHPLAILHIGGDGPEQGQLESLCRQLDLGGRVRFIGWVDDVRVFLGQSDIFVLPSLDEPFGIAVLEAMAMGKPIVATRTRGPLEILDDSLAYLVNPGDVDDLARTLCLAAADAGGRLQKAAASLALFKRKYAREAVVPVLIKAYQALSKPGK